MTVVPLIGMPLKAACGGPVACVSGSTATTRATPRTAALWEVDSSCCTSLQPTPRTPRTSVVAEPTRRVVGEELGAPQRRATSPYRQAEDLAPPAPVQRCSSPQAQHQRLGGTRGGSPLARRNEDALHPRQQDQVVCSQQTTPCASSTRRTSHSPRRSQSAGARQASSLVQLLLGSMQAHQTNLEQACYNSQTLSAMRQSMQALERSYAELARNASEVSSMNDSLRAEKHRLQALLKKEQLHSTQLLDERRAMAEQSMLFMEAERTKQERLASELAAMKQEYRRSQSELHRKSSERRGTSSEQARSECERRELEEQLKAAAARNAALEEQVLEARRREASAERSSREEAQAAAASKRAVESMKEEVQALQSQLVAAKTKEGERQRAEDIAAERLQREKDLRDQASRQVEVLQRQLQEAQAKIEERKEAEEASLKRFYQEREKLSHLQKRYEAATTAMSRVTSLACRHVARASLNATGPNEDAVTVLKRQELAVTQRLHELEAEVSSLRAASLPPQQMPPPQQDTSQQEPSLRRQRRQRQQTMAFEQEDEPLASTVILEPRQPSVHEGEKPMTSTIILEPQRQPSTHEEIVRDLAEEQIRVRELQRELQGQLETLSRSSTAGKPSSPGSSIRSRSTIGSKSMPLDSIEEASQEGDDVTTWEDKEVQTLQAESPRFMENVSPLRRMRRPTTLRSRAGEETTTTWTCWTELHEEEDELHLSRASIASAPGGRASSSNPWFKDSNDRWTSEPTWKRRFQDLLREHLRLDRDYNSMMHFLMAAPDRVGAAMLADELRGRLQRLALNRQELRVYGEASARQIMESISVFRGLLAPQLADLSRLLTKQTYRFGDHILDTGKEDKGLFIIDWGSVVVRTADRSSASIHVDDLLPAAEGLFETVRLAGDYFGELSLMQDGQCSMTAVVWSKVIEVWLLPKEIFLEVASSNGALEIVRKNIEDLGCSLPHSC